MAVILDRKKEDLYSMQISDMCRHRLLSYADTFSELAGSFNKEFDYSGSDRQSILDARKFWESRQVICSNLNEVSRIIRMVAGEVFSFRPMEERKRKMLVHALRAEGIIVEDICYMPDIAGNKALGITMYTEKKGGRPAKEVADMVSVLLRRPVEVSVTSPYLVDRQSRSFILVTEAKYVTLTGYARVVKEDETVSGDNYSFLESERGKLTMILSDGTGSGERASGDSERVLDLLEKMLEAGYAMDTAINLVNSALFAGGEEQNHPTLDICDINLYDGTCLFCKVGGAASFIKRGKKVERIEGGSLPLGIFQTTQQQRSQITLESGDYVIMMSDGVLDALGEEDYENTMEQAVLEVSELNPGVIAERLLQFAIRGGKGHIRDDMTILVAGIWEKSENT